MWFDPQAALARIKRGEDLEFEPQPPATPATTATQHPPLPPCVAEVAGVATPPVPETEAELEPLDPDDLMERAAIIEEATGCPRTWAELIACCFDPHRPPPAVERDLWRATCDAAGRAVDGWESRLALLREGGHGEDG